ncbi:MAG: AAC(3) family N-acetyltransferase [bacterium]
MKTYSRNDVLVALREVGVKKGDTVFFTARMFVVGRLEGVGNQEAFNAAHLACLQEAVGPKGTLVVPTYTQQVGRFGEAYHHETTPTMAGMFSEYVRTRPGAVRSFHPVFSLTALGPKAEAICGRVGTSAFGARSAYDNLFQLGGKQLCLGFSYESGHIVTGAHHVEHTYGVPYYYNKILKAPVYRAGVPSDKVFVLNVMYRHFGLENDYHAYVAEVDRRGFLARAPLGASTLYASDLRSQLEVGFDMLSQNVYAFLARPPVWEAGTIPFEGVESVSPDHRSPPPNWVGYNIMPG